MIRNDQNKVEIVLFNPYFAHHLESRMIRNDQNKVEIVLFNPYFD